MTDLLSDSVIMVTGGGSGLGAAVSDRLVDFGYRVSRTVRKSEMRIRETDRDITVIAEMRNLASLKAAVRDTVERFGRLDAVVFNAAVQGIASLDDITAQAWEEVVDVNMTAPLFLAQAAVQHLRATRGVFVGISSVHAHRGAEGRTMYAASKAALEGMMRGLSAELAGDGIRAVSLCLGPFDSPALRAGASRFYPDGTGDEAVAQFIQTQPLGQIGNPAQIGDLISFLLSPAGSFISGTTLTIDGGLTAHLPVPRVRS